MTTRTLSDTLHLGASRAWQRWLRRPATLAALAVLVALAIVWIATFVIAAHPPTLDQRVHDVASQLRCPTCNGETAADASTPGAEQMRAVIRQKLLAGESDQHILADFRASYGEDIMANPPPSGFTLIIWLGPPLMLLAGIALVALASREWRASPSATSAVPTADGVGLLPNTDATDMAELAERERLRAALRRELADEEGFPLATDEGGR
jgi:cytochrome c-type biogenesis protein CcmH